MKYPQHAAAMAAGALCEECPLYGCGRGPVPTTRVPKSKLFILGEAPGKHEVRQGVNFVGKSGQELEAGLNQGGLLRHDVTISNVLMCQPPESFKDYLKMTRKRGKDPVQCCAPRLARELEEERPKVVLAVGAQALQAFATYHDLPYGKGEDDVGKLKIHSILNQHGAPVEIPKGTSKAGIEIIYSALHPAFAMRSAREYKYVIRNDIGRAARGAVRGYVEHFAYERHIFLEGNQVELIARIEAVVDRAAKAKVRTCDIETDTIPAWRADIRCVGFSFREEGKVVAFVIPLKWRDGRRFWVDLDHERRARAAITRLVVLTTAYHNGMFDTAVLLNHKLIPEDRRMATWLDTLLLDLNTPACDLPRSLGAMTRRRFEVRMWKEDADAKDATGVASDEALHTYCGDDNVSTLRCLEQLVPEVKQYDTAVCSSIDHKLAPIYREAGDLGVWTNERVRAELSVQIRAILAEKRTAFLQKAGLPDSFNLRSPKQVSKWLYEDLALIPTLNTEGREFRPGDSPSTSIAAVLAIIDTGVEQRVEDALQHFLHYKSAEKLRSSYIENSDKTVEYAPDFRGLDDQPPLVIDGEVIFPARPLLAHMRIQWRLGGTPSGRTSATPGIQTIPSKAYGGMNLKVLYQAPPGHVIVGADLEQVEGRIYAVEAQDQVLLKAIKQGLDMHSLNAAMLFTEIPDPEHPTVMKEYHRIRSLPNKQKQMLRGIAKTVLYGECLAEGTLIVTQRGLVPIEEITEFHLLWDPGVGWVRHGGAVCRGPKDMIEYDGVVATPDHEVWVSGQPVPLATLAGKGRQGISCPFQLLGRSLKLRIRGTRTAWDILDAGPLNRFTINTRLGARLVSNSYGAEGDKLYEIFRTARDKGTLERLFPNVTSKDAMKWHEAWHTTHPETRRWQRQCEAYYRKHGYVVSRIHRRKRFFPGGPNKKNSISNFFIQSTSGDIKNNAVLAIVDAIPFRKWSKYTGFILDIHDDLKVCVPIDKAEYAVRVIDEVFRWEFKGIEFPPDKPLATWDLASQ